MTNIDVKQLVKSVSKSEFFMKSGIPLGYVSGLPVVKELNGKICLVIPYLRYKKTGVIDKTLVYPVKYTITVSLPHGNIVSLEDLSYNPRFTRVDFTKPIGLFRHDAIKQFTKLEFNEKRDELFKLYGAMVTAKLEGKAFPESWDKSFAQLIGMLLEPSVYPIYKALDAEFYNKYLA